MSLKYVRDPGFPACAANRSKALIGLPLEAVQIPKAEQVKMFFSKIIEECDENDIQEQLLKEFSIGQKVQRVRPKKIGRRKDVSSNRGKKRMTCIEKRNSDLLRLKKHNTTFRMFIPIHKMWREYALELLCGSRSLKIPKDPSAAERILELMKKKCKKLEFFGSILKITKSLCSEYIGLQGIVIRETKNTFSLVTTEDCVKMVPKLHSEFSFVVGTFSFSILGNHLLQRPVDKAKQNLKKHCLWL